MTVVRARVVIPVIPVSPDQPVVARIGPRFPFRRRSAWAVLSSLVLLAGLGQGCAEAGDSVSAERAALATRDVTSSVPRPATTRPQATTTSRVGAASSAPAPAAPSVSAPVTSGGNGPGVAPAPTSVAPAPAPTTAAPPTATPVSAPPGLVALRSVDCGGHDDGDWVVFRLSAPGVDVAAGYAVAPLSVAVAGDRAVVVTMSPVFDAVSSAPVFSGCRVVREVVRSHAANGDVTWVIGVNGNPTVTLVEPGPAGAVFAFVVKLRA